MEFQMAGGYGDNVKAKYKNQRLVPFNFKLDSDVDNMNFDQVSEERKKNEEQNFSVSDQESDEGYNSIDNGSDNQENEDELD